MLTFNRSLTRQVRSILRRTFNLPPRNYARTAVQLIGAATGLTIRCCSDVAAVQIHHATPQSAESLIVPFTLFDDCEGKRTDAVTIERDKDSQISAQWLDGRVPQLLRYDALEMTTEIPELPSPFVENSPDLLVALHQASGIADDCTSRYALSHIRLRGNDGSIAATDGRHLFVHSGFQFGFDSDALIPRTSVFGCPEMPHGQPVALGIQDGWLALRTGPVTLSWKLDPELRFPRAEECLRAGETDLTTLDIDEQDAKFLRASLRSLPQHEGTTPELTVDLNGSVALRAKPNNRPRPVEIVLNRSQRHGAEMRFLTDPRYLDKALELGFRRFHLNDPKGSVVGRDGQRHYVWMALDPQGAIDQTVDTDRIESASIRDTSVTQPKSHAKEQKAMTANEPVQTPPATKKANRKRALVKSELIDQAELLRSSLRQSLSQTVELIRSLRRHRQQSKLMRSTLASLKQLQSVGE